MGKTPSIPASLVSEGLSKMNIEDSMLKSHYFGLLVIFTLNLSSYFL